MKKLVIINEFLEDKLGHYYEYDKSVMTLFRSKGITVKIYARNTVTPELQHELDAIPFFSYDEGMKMRHIPVLGPFLYRFYNWQNITRQIRKIISIEGDANTVFFIPNIFWYNVLPYARAFGGTGLIASLLYRTAILEPIDINPRIKPLILKLYNYAFRLLTHNPNIRFFTDSDVIAAEFTNKYEQEMRVLPIPHLFEMQDAVTPQKNDMFRLFLPGGARLEKGIELITEALEYLQQKDIAILSRIIIVVQFFGSKEQEALKVLRERIEQLNCKAVFLGKLSSKEYQDQFTLADIILIPYKNDRGYRARTSGVLAEAFAGAKPVITSEGSWMDVQVKKYNNGLAVPDNSDSALAAAISDMISHYSLYKKRALEAKDAWLHFHSKENFYTVFLSPYRQ
jgi:glycosyltransferase involved in cell wall biosynthesis